MDLDDLNDGDEFEYGRAWELLQSEGLNLSAMNLTPYDTNITARSGDGDGINIIHNIFVKIIICGLYLFIVIFGIFGNGLVVFVVTRNKAMHTVTNFFIASLAVNDIIICALTVPLTPLYTFLEGWYFGPFMCHLFPLIQAASVYISTLTLTAIAVERFCVICFPYLPKLTTKSAGLIIASVWFLSLSICTPYAIYMKYSFPTPDNRGPRCDEDWPNSARQTFGTVSLVVQYSIPLVVITCSYVCIWMKLRSQASKGLSSSQRGREPSAILRKRRTNRMLVAMVIIFGCCWLPLNLINILNDYFPKYITSWEYFVLVFFLSHVVAVSSTCYNPLLYAWMNENFRKEFRTVLPCFSGFSRRSASGLHHRSSRNGYEKTGNGLTSAYINGDSDSTFIKTVSPQLSVTMRKSPNGSARTLLEQQENGRLLNGHLLAVPHYITLKLNNGVQDAGGDEETEVVYDV